MKKMRIGSGAGYSGDRIEPAIELAEKGNLDYLVFECLAERTIAIAQQRKMKDPEKGYDPLLAERVEAVLPVCREKRVKIITNMGAANPLLGMKKIVEVAKQLKVGGLKIAAVMGDDVLAIIRQGGYTMSEDGSKVSESELVKGEVIRYCLPNIGALNFVMHNALGGGVTCTLAMDIHGRSLSSAILEMNIPDK